MYYSNTCWIKFISTAALSLVLLGLATVVTDARSTSNEQVDGSVRSGTDYSSLYKRDTSRRLVSDSKKADSEGDSAESTGSTSSESKETENQQNSSEEDELMMNCTLPINVNNTKCLNAKEEQGYIESITNKITENKGMLLRTLYVTLGVTGLVVIYFVIRAVRLRRRRTKSRKYGIITQSGDHGDMEMEPLGDGDDEDDDYTVFELNGRKK